MKGSDVRVYFYIHVLHELAAVHVVIGVVQDKCFCAGVDIKYKKRPSAEKESGPLTKVSSIYQVWRCCQGLYGVTRV